MRVTTLAAGPRVELQLPELATAQRYQELGAFVRYCIDRIERGTGRANWWTVKIVNNAVYYCADVTVETNGGVVQASSNGFDAAVAGGEAFRRVETLLQFQREELAEVSDGVR